MIKKKHLANKVKPKLKKIEKKKKEKKSEIVGLFCSSSFYGQYFCLKGEA